MDEDWKKRPQIIEYWPDGVDYVMGMDESGSSDLVTIKRKVTNGKEDEIDFSMKDFTLTGVVVDQNRYDKLKNVVNTVKYKYWNDGMCLYKDKQKRVCFHSRDIRKKSFPFNNIEPSLLTGSLTEMIESINAKIISCHVDKLAHYKKYTDWAIHPYHIAVQFILERFCMGLNEGNKTGIVMLESRGKKEDKFVLDYIVKMVEIGTNKNSASHFKNILGVYFNPKWWAQDEDRSSFVILEYADLVCYPIHKQHRKIDPNNLIDPAYDVVEKKLFKYPDHLGRGLKIWRP